MHCSYALKVHIMFDLIEWQTINVPCRKFRVDFDELILSSVKASAVHLKRGKFCWVRACKFQAWKVPNNQRFHCLFFQRFLFWQNDSIDSPPGKTHSSIRQGPYSKFGKSIFSSKYIFLLYRHSLDARILKCEIKYSCMCRIEFIEIDKRCTNNLRLRKKLTLS